MTAHDALLLRQVARLDELAALRAASLGLVSAAEPAAPPSWLARLASAARAWLPGATARGGPAPSRLARVEARVAAIVDEVVRLEHAYERLELGAELLAVDLAEARTLPDTEPLVHALASTAHELRGLRDTVRALLPDARASLDALHSQLARLAAHAEASDLGARWQADHAALNADVQRVNRVLSGGARLVVAEVDRVQGGLVAVVPRHLAALRAEAEVAHASL